MPKMNMLQAINNGLQLTMRKYQNAVVFGEDVGVFGGVFRATSNLQQEFGRDRCFNTPLVEQGIVGFANGLAATFIACGQDPAQVVNSSLGHISIDLTEEGDIYCGLRLPCILVGTVGGGTGLPTQRECLEIMGCQGPGKAARLTEIVSGLLLAGELSITAGVIRGDFITAHSQKNQMVKQEMNLINA